MAILNSLENSLTMIKLLLMKHSQAEAGTSQRKLVKNKIKKKLHGLLKASVAMMVKAMQHSVKMVVLSVKQSIVFTMDTHMISHSSVRQIDQMMKTVI